MNCIGESMVLRAAEAVQKEREISGISKAEWAMDSYRRSLADGKTLKEFMQRLCHNGWGLM